MVCRTRALGSPWTWFLMVLSCALAPPRGYAYIYAHFSNRPSIVFEDLPAIFGNQLPKEGLMGALIESQPLNACAPISPAPTLAHVFSVNLTKFIALIRRHDCDFDVKVLHAQQAGFSAAVVYNVNSDFLLSMGFGNEGTVRRIEIPSVFTGYTASQLLRSHIIGDKGTYVVLKPEFSLPLFYYMVPFSGVMGLLILATAVTLLTRCVQYTKQLKNSMLSKEQLTHIPVHKFQKGDKYDVCAVCLEEYEDSDKLRVLPCSHAYHCHCVDRWLTQNRRTCPVCKRRIVDLGPASSPDCCRSECGSERGWSGGSEHTPLLQPLGPASYSTMVTQDRCSGGPEDQHRREEAELPELEDGSALWSDAAGPEGGP